MTSTLNDVIIFDPYKLKRFFHIPKSSAFLVYGQGISNSQSSIVNRDATYIPKPSNVLFRVNMDSNNIQDIIPWALTMPLEANPGENNFGISAFDNHNTALISTESLDGNGDACASIVNISLNNGLEVGNAILGHGKIYSIAHLSGKNRSSYKNNSWYVSGYIDGDLIIYRFDDNLQLFSTNTDIRGDPKSTVHIATDSIEQHLYVFAKKNNKDETRLYVLDPLTLIQISTYDLPYLVSKVLTSADDNCYVCARSYSKIHLVKVKYSSANGWKVNKKETTIKNNETMRDVAINPNQPHDIYILTDTRLRRYNSNLTRIHTAFLEEADYPDSSHPLLEFDSESNFVIGLTNQNFFLHLDYNHIFDMKTLNLESVKKVSKDQPAAFVDVSDNWSFRSVKRLNMDQLKTTQHSTKTDIKIESHSNMSSAHSSTLDSSALISTVQNKEIKTVDKTTDTIDEESDNNTEKILQSQIEEMKKQQKIHHNEIKETKEKLIEQTEKHNEQIKEMQNAKATRIEKNKVLEQEILKRKEDIKEQESENKMYTQIIIVLCIILILGGLGAGYMVYFN
tara:strand:+ start:1772 stop:3469 length:1698 start_codon:yes stop_codon:yes gene_type:complete